MEYKVVKAVLRWPSDVEKILNKHAKEGWKLVTIASDGSYSIAVFDRKADGRYNES